MKKIILLLAYFIILSSSGQNRSKSLLVVGLPSTLPPVVNIPDVSTTPGLIPGTEAFRFQSGLVTQFDEGSGFNFGNTDRWFSLGRLNIGSQTTGRKLYGFRLQNLGQGLTMGYSKSNETPFIATNPFIEWIGNDGISPNPVGSGNLEFYTASNPGIPDSRKLCFTLKSNLTSFFGTFSTIDFSRSGTTIPKLEINAEDLSGLLIDVTKANKLINYGAKINVAINQSTLSSNYGVFSSVFGSTSLNSINYGVYASATGTANIAPAGTTPTSGTYAGFFAGPVFASNIITGSDIFLKNSIKKEDNVLEKLQKLNPVTYNYNVDKDGLKLNFSQQLQHGFIAQELEKVYPEMVTNVVHPLFNEKNEQIGTKVLKAINYNNLISVLTKSLIELTKEVNNLKEQISANEKVVVVVKNNKNLSNNDIDLINEKGYYLGQNTPNPFKTSTIIEYSLPINDKNASILIFNLNGQTILEFKLSNQKGNVSINQGELLKGLYLYSLISDGQEIATKKMLVN